MPALGKLAGVPHHRLFYDLDAIIEAYTVGKPRALEIFGHDITIPPPFWEGISYGHANALGCELVFPEDSEVATRPIYGSLEKGIDALRQDIDFSASGRIPYYLDLWKKLQRAFPEEQLSFGGLKAEGPMTTAWILRGHDFFTDVYDDPPLAREYLAAVTDSIIQFQRFIRRVNGAPEVSEWGVGLVDDIAAMFRPELWPEWVIPFEEQYFRGLTTHTGPTTGKRHAHIENLAPSHLPYLDTMDIYSFDPSVSPRLTPSLVRDGCRSRFSWLLNPMQLRDFSEENVRRWVEESVAGGASHLELHIERIACDVASARKLAAFLKSAKNGRKKMFRWMLFWVQWFTVGRS